MIRSVSLRRNAIPFIAKEGAPQVTHFLQRLGYGAGQGGFLSPTRVTLAPWRVSTVHWQSFPSIMRSRDESLYFPHYYPEKMFLYYLESAIQNRRQDSESKDFEAILDYLADTAVRRVIPPNLISKIIDILIQENRPYDLMQKVLFPHLEKTDLHEACHQDKALDAEKGIGEDNKLKILKFLSTQNQQTSQCNHKMGYLEFDHLCVDLSRSKLVFNHWDALFTEAAISKDVLDSSLMGLIELKMPKSTDPRLSAIWTRCSKGKISYLDLAVRRFPIPDDATFTKVADAILAAMQKEKDDKRSDFKEPDERGLRMVSQANHLIYYLLNPNVWISKSILEKYKQAITKELMSTPSFARAFWERHAESLLGPNEKIIGLFKEAHIFYYQSFAGAFWKQYAKLRSYDGEILGFFKQAHDFCYQSSQRLQSTFAARFWQKSSQAEMGSKEKASTILGLDLSATKEEIKTAFHRSALQYHPDVWRSATEFEQRKAMEKMKEINWAYAVLTDKVV